MTDPARPDPATSNPSPPVRAQPASPQPAAPRPVARRTALFWSVLVTIGVAWGLTGPLSKLAVSTGNQPVGISFWTAAIAAMILSIVMLVTGRRPPLRRRHVIFYVVCGLLGTALPNALSYTAYQHLSVGVIVLVISLVPMATLAIALPLGFERPEPRRLAGIGLGAIAVLLITLPEASLPEPGQAAWVALPVIVSLSYAAENIYIAAARPADCDSLSILCGLSWGAVLLLTPVMLATGTWFDLTRFGPPEQAVLVISCLHICAYFGFIWLIGQAGPVFAAQVAYVVTGSGVLLGIAIYGERHSPWVWAALGVMFAGMALVKPREREGPG